MMKKVVIEKYPQYGLPPKPVALSEGQRAVLERIVRRATSAQYLVRRAKMILAFSQGANNEQAARQVGGDREMARAWRERWRTAETVLCRVEAEEGERGLEEKIPRVLSDQPRSGRPATFRADQVAQFIALSCEDPAASGRPISHWTAREVAEEAAKRRIVERISVRQAGRFLKRGGCEAPS
jgi:putative transposase